MEKRQAAILDDGRGADEFALVAPQLAAAQRPGASINSVVGPKGRRVAGRPNEGRDNVELARMINDRLAAPSD